MKKSRNGGKRLLRTPAPRHKKRLLGACILLMMTVLAVGTLIAFAEGKEGGSSYSLVIQKVFAEGLSDEAKAKAQNMTYTFRVEAQVKSGKGYESKEEIVTIKGEDSKEVSFGNPFKISVIEQTDDGGFKIGDKDWDVVKTECLSEMHVNSSHATVNISKDGGSIKVTRPPDAPTVTFRLTGEPLHAEKAEQFNADFPNSIDVTVAAGMTEVLGNNLPQGLYTITKLRAAEEGFSVLVGSREFDVGEGETGQFHINGTDSKVSIEAPDPVDGVVLTHHYSVSGRTSNGTRVERTLDVKSGETGVVEHLSEGTYTVKVSETYAGVKGYTVNFPETISALKRKSVSVPLYTNAYTTTRSWYIGDQFTVNATYIQDLKYGPLRDGAGNKLASTDTYAFNVGTKTNDNKVSPIRRYVNHKGSSGYNYVPNGTPTKITINSTEGQNKICFSIDSVTNSQARTLDVSWMEYTQRESEYLAEETNKWYKISVDDRGWLTISKPEDKSERGGEVKYYYTVTNSNNQPITDFTVTDINGNPIDVSTDEKTPDGTISTVTLKAGQTVKISGLPGGGTYKIKETVEQAPAMPFSVTLEDTHKTVTAPGGSIEIETLDERTVNISRPGDSSDDNNREYTYNIYRNGENEPINENPIRLHSGESTTAKEELGFVLPAGKYRIQAMDDQIVGFDVAYTDSSSLTSDYINTATVTFTNYFAPVQASYHVIHEYYLKNANGNYTFEGASPVFTKNCDGTSHDESGGHYSTGVHLLDVYGGHTYIHFDDAYGKVVSWPKGGEEKEVEREKNDIVTDKFTKELTGNPWKGSNGTGTAEDPSTRNYAYVPLTNLTCAMATKHDSATGAHDHGAQIIILRYYREDTPIEHGKYQVIHQYYQRTSGGDIWEGSRRPTDTVDVGLLNNDNRWKTYDAGGVEKIEHYQPSGSDVEYPYLYDGASYGRVIQSAPGGGDDREVSVGSGKEYVKDDTMTSVKATTEGDQIIILRYYRSGGYNVVHEYYYREKANQAEDSGSSEETAEENSNSEFGRQIQSRDGEGGEIGEGSSSGGTLTDSGGYTYTFEGKSNILSHAAPLESEHNEEHVTKVPEFSPDSKLLTYTYKDAVYGYLDKSTGAYRLAPYKTGATATAQEDEIIILRYYREEGSPTTPDTPPDKPDQPDKPGGGGGGGGKDPDPTPPPEDPKDPPTDPENPPTDPENPPADPEVPPTDPENPPTDPEHPTELPDPNDPDSPDEITIWENGVPKTYVKVWDPENEVWVYIPEEDVPLWNKVPQTGDESRTELWGALAAASLCGLAGLTLLTKKRKNR